MNLKNIIKKYNLKTVDKRLGKKYWSPIDVAYINDWVLRAAAEKKAVVLLLEPARLNTKGDL